ncbi:MAG: hypothetical protein H0V32_14130 [Nocardioidaceae bacterium]|jgi:hypothetical protein|nr:hypothetical protein [Nocardioidaceae bacterium]
MSRFHRPALPGDTVFDELPGDEDPALRAETGARVARLLVRGARNSEDAAVAERVVQLADAHGLDELAALWAQAPADSLAGALWRLYLLQSSVHRDPSRAAREFAAGRAAAPVHEVVAGVVDPPGPTEVRQLADTVLRGVVVADLAITLERAAAFARVLAVGRAVLAENHPHSTRSASRLVVTAEQLERAAGIERGGQLG